MPGHVKASWISKTHAIWCTYEHEKLEWLFGRIEDFNAKKPKSQCDWYFSKSGPLFYKDEPWYFKEEIDCSIKYSGNSFK